MHPKFGAACPRIVMALIPEKFDPPKPPPPPPAKPPPPAAKPAPAPAPAPQASFDRTSVQARAVMLQKLGSPDAPSTRKTYAAGIAPQVQQMQLAGGFQPGQTVYAQAGLNLRGDPSTGNRPVGAVRAGTPLQVVDGQVVNGFVKVTVPPSSNQVWVSAQYVGLQAPASASGGASGSPATGGANATGQPRVGFVEANYTDIGMVWTPGGMVFNADEAAKDLDRLKAAGITNVRVWATDLGGSPADMANKVDAIASMAQDRGMSITVDLYDGHNNTDLQNYKNAEGTIRQNIQTIIGQNKGHSNIVWSLGNEMQAPNQPAEFGNWYVGMVGEMRAAARPNRIKISAELVPQACGSYQDPAAQAAMRQIVRAVDVVSIHMYPNCPVDQAATGPYKDEYNAFREWLSFAQAAGKPVNVGEFAMDQGQYRDASNLDGWLRHLEGLGVGHVYLWQFMKDEAGHIDPVSYDQVDGPSFESDLRQGGWLQ